MIDQLITKLKGILVRGVIKSTNDSMSRQMCTCTLMAGEAKDRIERIQQFGFSSHCPSGASAVFAAVAADRNRMVLIGENHPEYRPRNLKAGEVKMYDAFQQFLYFRENNLIELEANGTLLIKAPVKIRFETPQLEVTGEIIDRVDTDGQTMSGMREVYNDHVHPENDSGGPTDDPNEKMGGGA